MLRTQTDVLHQGKLYAAAFVENRFSALRTSLILSVPVRTFYYSQGTQIYCAPTVDARPEWQHTMIHIALEGRCFVLSACQYAEEKDYPSDHAVANPDKREPGNIMIAGGSVIVNPLGKVLAGPLLGQEGVLSAELDLDDIPRGKFDLDVTGHYARPDGMSSPAESQLC